MLSYQEQCGSRNANDRALQDAFLSPCLPPSLCSGRCSVNLSVVDMLQLEDRPGLTLSSRSHQHVENHHHLQDSALAVISGTTGNAECVADIAGSLCLGRFSSIVTIWWAITRTHDVLLQRLFRLLLGLRTLQEASRYLTHSCSCKTTSHMSCVF